MEFVYKRAQKEHPDEPFFNYTEVSKSKIQLHESDDPEIHQEQVEAEEKRWEELVKRVGDYADQLTFNEELFRDTIVFDGIQPHRIIFRVMRGEPLELPSTPPVSPPPAPRPVEDGPKP